MDTQRYLKHGPKNPLLYGADSYQRQPFGL